MNADLTQRLPPELLYHIFDRCGDEMEDILCKPGHVCSRWRQIALRHPLICREAWLEGELTEARLGLFVTQLWAGMEHGLDVEITINTGDDLGFLVELIAECLSRCVALKLEYYATPDQLRELCDALCLRDAPRLRVLKLKLGVPDSIAEPDEWDEDEDRANHVPFVIPFNLFAGNAPVLRTLNFDCMAEWILLPIQPIPAFRQVDTLELHHCFSGGTDLDLLAPHLPLIRHLYVVSFWRVKRAPPVPSAQIVARMALESFALSLGDGNKDWIDAWIEPLDLCRVSSVEMEDDVSYGLLSTYSSTLRGPLEVSMAGPSGVLFMSAPKVDKRLRVNLRCLRGTLNAVGEFRILMTRVIRLEFASLWWRELGMLATSLPQTETLVLHLTKGLLPQPKRNREGEIVEPVRRVACPRLQHLVLVSSRVYCITTADLAVFMRAQLGHEHSDMPHVLLETRRVRLIGRRSPLQGLVRRIVQG